MKEGAYFSRMLLFTASPRFTKIALSLPMVVSVSVDQ